MVVQDEVDGRVWSGWMVWVVRGSWEAEVRSAPADGEYAGESGEE